MNEQEKKKPFSLLEGESKMALRWRAIQLRGMSVLLMLFDELFREARSLPRWEGERAVSDGGGGVVSENAAGAIGEIMKRVEDVVAMTGSCFRRIWCLVLASAASGGRLPRRLFNR